MHVHISYTIQNLNWYQLQYNYNPVLVCWHEITSTLCFEYIIIAKVRNMLEVRLCQLGYTLHSWCITSNDHMQFMCACLLAPVCYSGVVGMPSLQLSILLNHCHHPSKVEWPSTRWWTVDGNTEDDPSTTTCTTSWMYNPPTVHVHCNSSASLGYCHADPGCYNGSAVQVYCNIEGTCRGERGWIRVVHLWVSVLLAAELRQLKTQGSACITVLDVHVVRISCCFNLNHLTGK